MGTRNENLYFDIYILGVKGLIKGQASHALLYWSTLSWHTVSLYCAIPENIHKFRGGGVLAAVDLRMHSGYTRVAWPLALFCATLPSSSSAAAILELRSRYCGRHSTPPFPPPPLPPLPLPL